MDTTYSVKIEEEVKTRLQGLIESSGLSSKEFFQQMISQFELVSLKTTTPILAVDIDEVQKITTRLNNILIGIGERVNTMQDADRATAEKELKDRDIIITSLQNDVTRLTGELSDAREEIDRLNSENKRLNAERSTSTDLIAELRTMISAVTAMQTNTTKETSAKKIRKTIKTEPVIVTPSDNLFPLKTT